MANPRRGESFPRSPFAYNYLLPSLARGMGLRKNESLLHVMGSPMRARFGGISVRRALFLGPSCRCSDNGLSRARLIDYLEGRSAIFIHRCSWHHHADFRYPIGYKPKSNKEYWSGKFRENVKPAKFSKSHATHEPYIYSSFIPQSRHLFA